MWASLMVSSIEGRLHELGDHLIYYPNQVHYLIMMWGKQTNIGIVLGKPEHVVTLSMLVDFVLSPLSRTVSGTSCLWHNAQENDSWCNFQTEFLVSSLSPFLIYPTRWVRLKHHCMCINLPSSICRALAALFSKLSSRKHEIQCDVLKKEKEKRVPWVNTRGTFIYPQWQGRVEQRTTEKTLAEFCLAQWSRSALEPAIPVSDLLHPMEWDGNSLEYSSIG